ncbi:MAG: hypothetical protein J6W16_06960 [Methanobrevibacter sp.]|nr:hypothetical protein [Methanobrevibacter sp.]MBP5785304.1 hypothetical protein [Methanobrevibacter sp.]
MGIKVRIKETLEKVVEIEARNRKEALEIAQINYLDAESDYVLTADDYSDVNFQVVEE